MNSSGYSGTPLYKKLNIKQESRVLLDSEFDSFAELLLPDDFEISYTVDMESANFVILFCNEIDIIGMKIREYQEVIRPDGILWVSWYKKSSKKQGLVNEDVIRRIALSIDLVDIKVCAIDKDWSGLKLMIRKELR